MTANSLIETRSHGRTTRVSVFLAFLAALHFASVAPAAEIIGSARLIAEREGHTATLLGKGSVLVVGGRSSGGPTSVAEIYDPLTRTFSIAGSSLEPRADHVAVRLTNGRVLVIGGRGAGEALTSTELFDPKTNTFSAGPFLSHARSGHTATLLADGRVVVIGGDAAGSAEIYEPATGLFHAIEDCLTVARSLHAAVFLRDGNVLVAGGVGADGAPLASAEILAVGSLSFSDSPIPMLTSRSRPTLRLLPDGKVHAIGGDSDATMEIFNPSGHYFSSLGHLGQDPAVFSAALRNTGRAALIGSPASSSPALARLSAEGESLTVESAALELSNYTLTELPGLNAAILVGGLTGGALQSRAVLFDASSATVTTDKSDYHPGETVTITGTGWLPGETVSLNLHRDTNDPPDTVLTAVADVNGNFTNAAYVCQEFDAGVTFVLTATGQTSGYTAQTTFTDSNIQNNVSLSPTSVTVTAGNPAAYTVTVQFGGNNTPCTAPLNISALPAGTGFSFAPPSVTGDSDPGDNLKTSTLTITTTGGGTPTPAGTYPFTMTVSASGTGCAGADRTVNGTLIVNAPANAAPDAVNDSGSTNEDTALTFPTSGAGSLKDNDTDANHTNAQLFITSVTDPPSGTAVLNVGGSVTYTPDSNYFGSDSFNYTLCDPGADNDAATTGDNLCDTATVSLTVTSVNDAPSFVKGADQNVDEDSGPHTVVGWATAISAGPANESGQTVSFSVTGNTNPGLFSAGPAVAANGTLSYTLTANAFGSATIDLTISDNGGTANGGVDTRAPQTFTITVNAVNDAPSFVKGTDQTVNEDSGPHTVVGWATSISAGPANESAQTVSFLITNNTNPGLFSAGPAVSSTGTLTYSLMANANGSATITLKAKDDGGIANGGVDESPTQIFDITVTAVNDAPSFVKGPDQTVAEDSGAQTVVGWATGMSPGPTDESGQNVTFSTTNNNNALFSAQPSVAVNGTLTYTPAANAFGSATVTVRLSDDGGTANGGVDFSEQTFTITVTPVNDAPANLLLALTATTINENGSTSLSGSFTDVEAFDLHTVVISWGDGSSNTTVNLAAGVFTIPATAHTYLDDNPTGSASDVYAISVTVTDNGTSGSPPVNDFKSTSGTTSVTVHNIPPSLNTFTSTDYSLAIGGSATVTGVFTDVGTLDTHTCVVNWDDGAGNVAGTVASGACTATKTFTATGIYTVSMKITDDDTGGSNVMELMISVFDPNGGFVTGGGWIDSPEGAYTTDPTLVGRAHFGFVSKYKRNSTTNIPEGQTEFQFKAGNLNFHSSAYDAESLVVSGNKAQYKGMGTINGVPGYRFVLTAYDGQAPGGDGTDKFRIKITNGGVVYDNRLGESDDIDDADPTAIGGGSIVIHKGK